MERLVANKFLNAALETELQISMLEMEREAGIKPQKKKEIYCGDEYTAEFLQNALNELLGQVKCEIFTIDGEYHLEVEI